MNKRISKSTSRRPPTRSSKRLQERLLDAATRDSVNFSDCPHSQSVLPPSKVGVANVPVKSTKRRLEEIELPAAKRSHLVTGVEEGRVQTADETTTIQHPKPKPARAAFLEPNPRFDSATPDSFVSKWLESIGSDRNTHCRSDSCPSQIVREPISRKYSNSAPPMGEARDAQGFVLPTTPASAIGQSQADVDSASLAPSDATDRPSSRGSRQSLVDKPAYRKTNLASNHIYFQPRDKKLPAHVANIVNRIRKDRGSPGPSREDVLKDKDLGNIVLPGTMESAVDDYFRNNIFPKNGNSLQRSFRHPMARDTVPNTGSIFPVSNPVPDMLYGFAEDEVFPQEQVQLFSMRQEFLAYNSQFNSLVCPFFVIEFKGAVLDMPAAANQCIGGSASCVNITERLNRRLAECNARQIDSAAFSIAMNGELAQIYITWKHNELDYYMAPIAHCALQDPEQYLKFRQYVLNIIDYGTGKRLKDIRSSLRILLGESRKTASKAAKSRPPPSEPVNRNKRARSSR
ncbi:hypothetical protein GGR51DRAFT_379209 [Nemania sp. FL0031]|nr:hypothetical protein GGR51DRAFT_379209 [Nemania sp. FL0031]